MTLLLIEQDALTGTTRRSTNTRVPSPYWVAVSPVLVPLSSCNDAADALIEWFGPEELKYVVGGERWWQVRGLDGIDAEWIAERDHIGEGPVGSDKKFSWEEQDIIRMEQLKSVMVGASPLRFLHVPD